MADPIDRVAISSGAAVRSKDGLEYLRATAQEVDLEDAPARAVDEADGGITRGEPVLESMGQRHVSISEIDLADEGAFSEWYDAVQEVGRCLAGGSSVGRDAGDAHALPRP